MGSPYVGEIRIFAGNFAPNGWAFCNGALLSIAENEVLFNLIGTTYGGDGQETFGLPDLRGRAPIHFGTGPGLPTVVQGQVFGTEQVTLITSQIPAHTHPLLAAASKGNSASPVGAIPAADAAGITAAYSSTAPSGQQLAASSVSSVGGNQPHENMQPFLVVNYIISLYGIYPQQS